MRKGKTKMVHFRENSNVRRFPKFFKIDISIYPTFSCLTLDPCSLPPSSPSILSYMDTISLTKLEQCCHLLRHTIVTTREYRRRVRRIIGYQAALEEEEEDNNSYVVNSAIYKCKLVKFLHR
jgi:hypothetical protein